MATHYILIDFENVQPSSLEALKQQPFNIVVFVGANQVKIPFGLAADMQALGEAARYVKVDGTGKNALDFHIAYYIGELSARDPKACFHVISRDTGFDTLIQHLRSRDIRVQRERDLVNIPAVRMSMAKCTDDVLSIILKNLASRGQARPSKVKSLANTISSLFPERLSEQQLSTILQDLEQRRYIRVSNGNVSYRLPCQVGGLKGAWPVPGGSAQPPGEPEAEEG